MSAATPWEKSTSRRVQRLLNNGTDYEACLAAVRAMVPKVPALPGEDYTHRTERIVEAVKAQLKAKAGA